MQYNILWGEKILPDFMLHSIKIDSPVILPKAEQPQLLIFLKHKYLISVRIAYAMTHSTNTLIRWFHR